MQKIGNITNTADINGEWTNGKVATGVSPTIIDAGWLNTVQRELIAVLSAASLVIDPTDDTQVISALEQIFLKTSNNLLEIKNSGELALSSARSNLGLGSVATRIVGTGANQIPDMASFASGSNGNGAYYKFPNGTQYCRNIITIAANSSVVWTFPLSFASQPLVTPPMVINPTAAMPSAMWTTGITQTAVTFFNPNSTGSSIDVFAIL